MKTKIPVRISWLSAEQGGRSQGPPGSPYRTVAQFPGEQDAFSVTLEFVNGGPMEHPASLAVLFEADLQPIVARLVPGTRLEIREGRRVVAHCRVTADPLQASNIGDERVATIQT